MAAPQLIVDPPSHAPDWSRAARAGRDAVLPAWLREGASSERARFDSAVVRGNGVSALVCAGRLARSEHFHDRVVVAAPRAAESPKLINGCTLRARSLDYYSAAFGVSPERILDAVFGERAPAAASHSQYCSLFRRRIDGRYEPERMGEFMPRRAGAPAYAYGTRNSRLVAALAELGDEAGIHWSDAGADSVEACQSLSPGETPLVVNGSHLPLEGLPASGSPSRFVIAWQCTMRRTGRAMLPRDASMIAGVAHREGLDIGVFYPFADPLTPEADAYGLFYRVVRPGAVTSKEEAIAQMRETTVGVARAIGWEPVNEEAAAAGALVPGFPWSNVEAPRDDTFDLHRTFGAGVPIITGCGMARAGLAGWVAAEAILEGRAPAPEVNASLRRWRRLNRWFCAAMEDRSGAAAAAFRRFPTQLFRRGADLPDTWAGVSGEPNHG